MTVSSVQASGCAVYSSTQYILVIPMPSVIVTIIFQSSSCTLAPSNYRSCHHITSQNYFSTERPLVHSCKLAGVPSSSRVYASHVAFSVHHIHLFPGQSRAALAPYRCFLWIRIVLMMRLFDGGTPSQCFQCSKKIPVLFADPPLPQQPPSSPACSFPTPIHSCPSYRIGPGLPSRPK
jgi:hypothetical protein